MTDDTKLPLTSPDLTDALLTQLREAAPQVFSEGRVDFAKLQAALGEHIETGAERYGLNWAGKREAFRNVQIPSVAALRPQPEESVNWDSTANLIIDGDTPSPPFAKGGTTAGGLFAEQATDAHPPLQKGGRGDLGFRAFKLDSSNFKIWQADAAPKTAEQLAEQLNLYADNVQAERGEQDRLYELVLKSGFPLSAKIEAVAVGDKTAFAVAEGTLLICLAEHLDQATLRAMFARNPQMMLCLDAGFDGNDALKTNTVLEAKSHGIIFKTV